MTRRARGFTLLEVVIAMAIFFLVIALATEATSASYDQALGAERARQLRLLADRKLGEIAVFERHFDEEQSPEGDFQDELPEELRDLYEGWTWRLDVTDVTVFGTQKDENAPYLFESDDTKDATNDGTASEPSPSASTKKGETQVLRQLVLTISAPGEDGGEGDSLEVVTFMPQVPAKTAGGAAPQNPGGGGDR